MTSNGPTPERPFDLPPDLVEKWRTAQSEPRQLTREMIREAFNPKPPEPVAEPTLQPGTSEPVRWVTCVSCAATFAAREYPPKECTACGIHFSHKELTAAGDTLDKVQKRAARKALRKGKR